MKINLYCVGKIKERAITLLISEYMKRLQGYAEINIIEVPDEKIPNNASLLEEEKVKQVEGMRILKLISSSDYVITFDLAGKEMDSISFATYMSEAFERGKSTINFIIGGSLGLSPEIKKRANSSLSFSRLTFPHQLMRVFVLEQIYRAFRINNHEPYHK
jgi:23S rRNA (pseudouridine1915-N3)-methyltransferase